MTFQVALVSLSPSEFFANAIGQMRHRMRAADLGGRAADLGGKVAIWVAIAAIEMAQRALPKIFPGIVDNVSALWQSKDIRKIASGGWGFKDVDGC